MHDMTVEDLAALGHFVRRWTRARPLNHARMIARPEAQDYRAMLARLESGDADHVCEDEPAHTDGRPTYCRVCGEPIV